VGKRLLLIANANAKTMTPRVREVITKALSADYQVRVADTKRHGHAIHVARGAAHEGFDLVVALGGDGTVNEVANGLAGSDVPLAVIPGGGTNVFARSLGIPQDPVEAVAELLENGDRGPRRIPLGRVDDRYFVFGCGMGFDAAIVRQVERRQRLKKAVGEWYYVWSGLRIFLTRYDRRRPHVRMSWGEHLEHERTGLFLGIAQKASPFTYLGDRELRVCPDVTPEGGIDCFALDSLKVFRTVRIAVQAFGSAKHVRNRHAVYVHDEARIRLESDVPLPVQMDGEYLGERTVVDMHCVPDALALLG